MTIPVTEDDQTRQELVFRDRAVDGELGIRVT